MAQPGRFASSIRCRGSSRRFRPARYTTIAVLTYRVYANRNYRSAAGRKNHVISHPHESQCRGETRGHGHACCVGQTSGGAPVGVAKVPEPRLVDLAKLYNPKKITYATVQYVDVGGMQKDRNRDALAPLREVDTIAHVIRLFDDPSVPHAAGSIDPLRDATNLELELILADHDQITRRLERLEKDLKKKKDPLLEAEKAVLEKCKAHLESEKPLRELELTADERKPIGGFLFLSQRPMLYVLNLGDDEAAELSTAVERHKLGALQGRPNTAVIAICGRLEAELAQMEEKEAGE